MLKLRARIHISWLIAFCSIGVIVGIALAATIPLTQELNLVWPIVGVSLFLFACIHRRSWAISVALVAGLILGGWRGGIEQAALMRYKIFYGKIVTVQGVVSDDASYGPGGDQRLSLNNISIDGTTLHGQVWISTDLAHAVERSDRMTLRGKLGFGFGSMSARIFHARILSVARPVPGDVGLHIRDWFAEGIRTAIPEPEASLASGYLVGQRSALPTDLDTQLKTVGLTHAVVASGYNLTILVSLARQLLLGLSKYLATLSAAAMIIGFISISGFSPSMVRAGLVTSLSLAAWYYGRRLHPLVLLPFAAAITALFNPFYVWGDIGWYLSFTSFAGVILLAPLVQHTLWKGKERPGVLAQILIDTMSAQVATLPIMIMAFGHYSPYALLANLLVLPLIPLTMLLTFLAGVVGLVIPAAAHVVGLPADLILRYMTWIVAHIAELPGAQGDLAFGAPALVASYVLLASVVIILWRKTGYNFRQEPQSESSK